MMAGERVSKLPKDILYSIFLSLPSKYLRNCLFVSNYWRSILSDPNFVSDQLLVETNKTFTSDGFIKKDDGWCAMLVLFEGRFYYYPQHEETLQILMPDDAQWRNGCGFVPYDHYAVQFPLTRLDFCDNGANHRVQFGKYMSVSVVGFSGGIFCLNVVRSMDEHQVMLWNPVINRCMILVRSCKRLRIIASGFGFEPVSMDHKMVAILEDSVEVHPHGVDYDCDDSEYDYDECIKYRYTVLLYSLAYGSWKSLPLYSNGRITKISQSPIFVNGVVNWIVRDERRHNYVLTFNIREELFDTIKLPYHITKCYSDRRWILPRIPEFSLITIEDTPAVIRHEGESTKFDVWVMEDHLDWRLVSSPPTVLDMERSYYFLRECMDWKNHECCDCDVSCSIKAIFGLGCGMMNTLVLTNKEGEERSWGAGVDAIKGETIDLVKLGRKRLQQLIEGEKIDLVKLGHKRSQQLPPTKTLAASKGKRMKRKERTSSLCAQELRRSSRQCKTPTYLKDFICNSQ